MKLRIPALLFALIWMTQSAFGTIRPYDTTTPSYFQFELETFSVSEDVTNAVITIIRNGDFREIASVDYATVEGTATEPEDYSQTGGRIVFSGGECYKRILIPIKKDSLVEGDETFKIVLSAPSANAVILQESATVVIKDVVAPPRLAIKAAGAGKIALTWKTGTGTYVLQRASDTQNPTWENVAATPVEANGELSVTERLTATHYFYRLAAQN